jgi:DNA-binding response OmpR family regulator
MNRFRIADLGRPGHGACACIVESNSETCSDLARALRSSGWRTLTASNAEEAFAIVREREIGMMIVDLMLPDMSGLLLLQQLRTLAPGALLIAVSDVNNATTSIVLELAYHAGADLTLPAPVTAAALTLAVSELITNNDECCTARDASG